MTLALVFGAFGVFLLAAAIAVLDGVGRIRRENRDLARQLQALEARVLPPDELAVRLRRLEEVEEQKRKIHGVFGPDGT